MTRKKAKNVRLRCPDDKMRWDIFIDQLFDELNIPEPIKKTPREMYDHLYKEHYRFLTQNHMAKDRSRRLATIYAVQNTWKVYNQQTMI